MIKVNLYIRLHEVLSRVLRHPLCQKVDMELAIQYAVDFIHIFGLPDMFEDREEIIEIHDFRGKLPCDIVSVTQVMDMETHACLRSMTDNFNPDGHEKGRHSLAYTNYKDEATYKILNTVIITSMKEGCVKITYKAIPVDEDGYPLIIDNSTYLKALELYIKKEVFTILFETNKLAAPVLLNILAEYAWRAGLLLSEFSIPSESEMESLCRSWCTLILRTTDFDNGWRNLGDREYLRLLK